MPRPLTQAATSFTQLPDRTGQVIVVGAGPTGLSLALLLARAGIRSVLIERRAQPVSHPAGCILNTRTMEVFRELGIESAILHRCQDVFERNNITWVSSLAGRELARLNLEPNERQLSYSATHIVQFPQHRLEPMMWDSVRTNGLIDFRPGVHCAKVNQTGNVVEAVVHGEDSTTETVITGDYLVGCDGSDSRVRTSAGIDVSRQALQTMIGVHFHADLGRFVDHRKSVLYWILGPQLFGVLIAHWLPCEWVLFFPYFPPQQSPDQFDEAFLIEKIFTAVGTRELPDLKIDSIRPWTMSAGLADVFQSGRVFLAGDAAHVMPPTGGLGLNTGVQDAHNLAWKLALVMRGKAAPQMLDSYETERRPVAQFNLQHSCDNYWKMNTLSRLAGVDFRNLERMKLICRSRIFQMLPKSFQARLVNGLVSRTLTRFCRFDSSGERGERLRETFQQSVPAQIPHYLSLGLDLGCGYESGVMVADDLPRRLADDPIVDYQPTTSPGCRLPHFWVEHNGQQISIHDFLPVDGFLLITDSAGRDEWHRATERKSREFPVAVRVVSIGSDKGDDAIDVHGKWPEVKEVGPGGAVLVRPDGHVSWRCRRAPACPGDELMAALRKLLPME